MKVALRKYQVEDLKILDEYILPYVQQSYTVTPRQWIENKQSKNRHPITIWYNDKPAGFFALDTGNDRFNYSESESSVLLRALSINPELQGKGIGTQAMAQVSDLVKEQFPGYNEIILGVNERNIEAYNLYLKCGFIDTGRKYLGGRNGPQIIMSKNM